MKNLLKKLIYEIERRKYIHCLKENPEDTEVRRGLLTWHLKHGYYAKAFEQYKLIKDKYSKGARFEELLEAKEALKSKGFSID
ncbi:hypothetical protein J4433_01600 [Candidatus Pacearchaeota archaeon]|nr:hypothetical protein [Candidatus Pacearchaeota archaeon]